MKWVGYCRVSSKKQGKSGLGLAAQQKMITDYVTATGGELVETFVEVESGKIDERPELQRAIRTAELVGGRVLVGKLDRLSRDLHFITHLQKTKVDFVVCDLPNCDSFTIHIYGALAQRERELISARTKAGLAAAKARGVKLGSDNLKYADMDAARAKGVESVKAMADDFASKVKPMVTALRAQGATLREIAIHLDRAGVKTARGGRWTATAVKNVLARQVNGSGAQQGSV
ncbi:recombinase family protein [Geomonas subterranea]|uniref:Recombinase family protein n=1 Tax=Geomonas subterranea TaxID=2847989 RepID=A0ABX8LQ13_9BACT|nr:recombinase family protein [Geomonas subterranea]QXE92800.1 recombinase family protein [Geomonas subterranea]QXM09097.1 recombinase family protein [Geomonas subterranea]